MTEAVTGTGEAQPADDIRSALAAAIASQDEQEAERAKPAEPAKPAKAEASEAEPPEPDEPAEPAEGEGDKAPTEEAAKEEAEKPEADKAASGKEPPANWSAADKQAFKGLPETAQQFLLKRHTQMEADYTKKTQAIAELKKEYEPVDKMFEPYRDTMKSKGFTPSSLIRAWANVETELAGGEDRAIRIIAGLVNGYKVNPAKVAAALGIRPTQAAPAPAPAQAADPAAAPPQPTGPAPIQLPAELQDQINRIQQRIDAEDQRRAYEQRARMVEAETRVHSEIETFKSKADEKGNLLHPHFAEVEDDMTALANAAIARKQPVPSLEKLYETAVWANPSTREKVLTAQAQAADEKRKAEARAKAAAAKKAGSSVTGAPGTAQAPVGRRSSDLSLREQLLEAAEEHDSAA